MTWLRRLLLVAIGLASYALNLEVSSDAPGYLELSVGTEAGAAANVGDYSLNQFSATTTPSIGLPSTINPGETLLAVLCVDGPLNSEPTWPMGWTSYARENHGTVAIDLAWLEAVGTEDGTNISVTIPASDNGSYLVFSLDSAEDPDTQAPEIATTNATSGTVTFGTVTPTGGSKDYLFLIAVCSQDQAIDTWSSGYAEGAQIGDGVASALGWAQRTATTTSETPGNATMTPDQWASVVIAVHPGAAPPASNLLKIQRELRPMPYIPGVSP